MTGEIWRRPCKPSLRLATHKPCMIRLMMRFRAVSLVIRQEGQTALAVSLQQPGLLRPLACFEWSDGTLRYVLLVTALLTPRPPPLLVLNEPETSLHPDLIQALARLIIRASEQTQVWVISHSSALVQPLEYAENLDYHQL